MARAEGSTIYDSCRPVQRGEEAIVLRRVCGRVWVLAAVAGFGAPAMAQYEMGDGYGLQRDLGRYGTENVPIVTRQMQLESMRMRNAIVTGNVGGGRSFRGDIDYTAPYEFRGELGSNDLFSFRRDSTYAGLGGVGARGMESLQYQFMATIGSAPSSAMLGPVVQRSGAGVSSAQFTTHPYGMNLRSQDVLGERTIDSPTTGYLSANSELGTAPTVGAGTALMQDLRSTSTYVTNRAFQPELLYAVRTQNGVQGLTASSLRGVRSEEFDADTSSVDATEISPFAVEPERPETGEQVEPIEPERPETQPLVTPYDELLGRMQARDQQLAEEAEEAEAEQQDDTPAWQQRIIELQNELRELEEQDMLDPEAIDGGVEEETGEEELLDPRRVRLDPETLRLISESGGTVESFIPSGGARGNLYSTHIGIGEGLLKQGRFFDAEERFTAALSIKPDDVTSQVGRIHAQIGAGVFLSAGTNLRVLLTDHPEVGGVRYKPDLLPGGERVGEVVELLRGNIADEGAMRRESALILAYLGFQTGDAQLLREGLDAMNVVLAGDPLVEYAERVWGGS